MNIFKVILLNLFVLIAGGLYSQVEIYTSLQKNDIKLINAEISKLEKQKENNQRNAYLGVLYMKKSNFEKEAKQKINIFKKGKQLLENSIKSKPENVEYRFLRLAIQENAPKILKYNKEIAIDKKLILSNFKKLSPFLKKIISEYSKTSDYLIIKNTKY